MPDEKKQTDETDEATEVEASGEPRPRLGTSADVAEVVARHYAKVARPGR